MSEELQRLIDGLALSVGRAVAVDDLDFRLLAFTSHHGQVDAIRQEAILNRQAPESARQFVRACGVARATGPVRLPANDELGMQERVCIPLRSHDRHYGYLWLVDSDQSLTTQQLDLGSTAAAEGAEILHRDRMRDDLADARASEVLRDLLDDDDEVRAMAAERVADLLDLRGGCTVLVVGPATPGAVPKQETRYAVTTAIDDALLGLPRRTFLRLIRPDHGIVVLTAAAGRSRPALAEGIAVEGLLVGASAPSAGVETLPLALVQAQRALRVGQVLPSARPVARWGELGVYALLSELSLNQLTTAALDPDLLALLQEHPALAQTLERFLDRAGDTSAVAEDLHVHRASVYYRLKRAQEILGVDLDDGEQRLRLHLSLKLARLIRGA